MRVLENIEPRNVMKYFEDICSIPHGSGDTGRISQYCIEFAKLHALTYYRDNLNNVIIKKDACKGYESAPPVIIQGHLDMVCEKDSGTDFDFSKDALRLYVKDGYIKARGTTLGGDDGIAIAYVLALLDSDDIPHPAIEAVFTTDEETGMHGAKGLDVSKLTSKTLINIDSEEEGIFTVSCAGGARVEVEIPLIETNAFSEKYLIEISGLTGGHSGVEINRNRANANKLIGEILNGLDMPFGVSEIKGGVKNNAIPAHSSVNIDCSAPPNIDRIAKIIKDRFKDTDPHMKISGRHLGISDAASYNAETIIGFLNDIPNGVTAMSKEVGGLVETSLNLGVIGIKDGKLTANLLLRSSKNHKLDKLIREIDAISKKYGGQSYVSSQYPAWEYRKDSPLRDTLIKAYKTCFGKEPEIEAIHAGLECGIFAGKINDIDCVSIGPNILDIHTVNERLDISSVQRTWVFLKEALKNIR